MSATVYVFRDNEDGVLYVGCSLNYLQRLNSHKGKFWFADVGRIDVSHFDTKSQALEEERHLIARFNPPYNDRYSNGTVELEDPCAWFRFCGRQAVKWAVKRGRVRPSCHEHLVGLPSFDDKSDALEWVAQKRERDEERWRKAAAERKAERRERLENMIESATERLRELDSEDAA